MHATGSEWYDRSAELLRRVTEAANRASTTEDLLAETATDIATTMGWHDARVTAAPEDADAADPAPGPTVDDGDGRVLVPVIAGGRTAFVLAFSPPTPVKLDDDLAALLANTGRQLGLVVDREQARAALDERTRELERSNAELERFAYVASHDLQEPLRKIVGFAELLDQRHGDTLGEEGGEYLGYVVDGARRMQQLIKDLLAYSRAGRARPASAPVALETLVADVVDALGWTVTETGAEVTVGPLPTALGDASQLSEVVLNIISNALKYCDGTPHLAITGDERGGQVELLVADDGIGIEPEYREQVFEVFRRLHGPTEYAGTGIGLAITRRLVEANGGRVWITSNEPRGSVVHVTLPSATGATP